MSHLRPAEVRAWADVSAGDTVVEPVIDAVETKLAERYIDYLDEGGALKPDVRVALLMQVSRLLARRQTPNGIAQFGTELAMRVSRWDPDIDDMLGDYKRAPLGVI